jgi:hypothetical protein
MILHFDTQAIVDAGADENTMFLEMEGRTLLGMCIEGIDDIRIVPPVH